MRIPLVFLIDPDFPRPEGGHWEIWAVYSEDGKVYAEQSFFTETERVSMEPLLQKARVISRTWHDL